MQQSQAFGQYQTKESWQQIQPTIVFQPLQTTQRLNGTYDTNYQTNQTFQQPFSQPIYTMSQTQLPTRNNIYVHVPLRHVGQNQQQTVIAPQKLFNLGMDLEFWNLFYEMYDGLSATLKWQGLHK